MAKEKPHHWQGVFLGSENGSGPLGDQFFLEGDDYDMTPFNPNGVDIDRMGGLILDHLKKQQHKVDETIDQRYAARQVEAYLWQATIDPELSSHKQAVFNHFIAGTGVPKPHWSSEYSNNDQVGSKKKGRKSLSSRRRSRKKW